MREVVKFLNHTSNNREQNPYLQESPPKKLKAKTKKQNQSKVIFKKKFFLNVTVIVF